MNCPHCGVDEVAYDDGEWITLNIKTEVRWGYLGCRKWDSVYYECLECGHKWDKEIVTNQTANES